MKRSLVVVFGLVATLDVGGTFAQSPPSLDILGVRLGMPRDAAVELLSTSPQSFAVTNTSSLAIEDLGTSVWHISLDSQHENAVHQIVLDFALPPTESTVQRIYRNTCYNCSPSHAMSPDAPSAQNFVRSLAEKLGTSTPTLVKSRSADGEATVYVWTPDGKLLSSTELGHRLRYPARCTNPPQLDSVRTNAGINFNLAFDDQNFANACGTVAEVSWFQERGVITHFDMTFTDVSGLLSSLAKSDGILQAKKSNEHQQELQRANQNRPKL